MSQTDECLRYSLKPSQGFGWSEFGDGDWPFPESRVGALKILDSVNQERQLVLDASTGRIFEIGVRDIFLDAVGDYGGGTEIPTEIILREEVGDPEHFYRKSLEHHIYFRPQDEDNQGADGYTDKGYRDAFEVTLALRKDGQTQDRLKTRDIPLEGDLVFKHDEDAHRWQPKVNTTTSEYRIVGFDDYYRALDQMARLSDREMSETSYERLLANVAVHLSRYSLENAVWQTNGTLRDLQNRATGQSFTGAYAGFVNGPEGKTGSGVSFASGSLTSASTVTVSGNFAVTMWIRTAIVPITLFTCGFTIRLLYEDSTYKVTFLGGGDSRTATLDWNGTDWMFLCIQRNGNLMQMYQGTSLVFSQDVGNAAFSGQAVIGNGTVQMFDVRLLNNALSARAIDYYNDDVLNHEGKATCELF